MLQQPKLNIQIPGMADLLSLVVDRTNIHLSFTLTDNLNINSTKHASSERLCASRLNGRASRSNMIMPLHNFESVSVNYSRGTDIYAKHFNDPSNAISWEAQLLALLSLLGLFFT